MVRLFIVFQILVWSWTSIGVADNQLEQSRTKAIKGIVDLSSYDFSRSGPIALDGQWFFHKSKFISPEQPESVDGKELVKVPSAWRRLIINGTALEPQGYGSYQLKILLPNPAPQGLALKTPLIGSGYRLYLNGRKITQVGTPGESEGISKPANKTELVDIRDTRAVWNLVLHVSNHHWARGGIWDSFLLGDSHDLHHLKEKRNRNDFLLTGLFLMIAVFHILVFLMMLVQVKERDYLSLSFSLMIVVLMIRLFYQDDILLLQFLPEINYNLSRRLEYGSFYLVIPLFAIFLRLAFPKEVKRFLFHVILTVGFICAAMVAVTPTLFFSSTLDFYQSFTVLTILYGFFIIVSAVVHKRNGANFLLVGISIIFVATINDMLYSRHLLQTGYFVKYALVIMIISQSLLIISRLTTAFKLNRELSQNLENKVEERTVDLNNTVEQLKVTMQNSRILQEEANIANRTKSQFLANMSHEIRTPMNAVIGMIDLMLETKLDRDQRDYAQTIQNSAEALMVIINDILDFSKIEAGKLDIELINFDLRVTVENVSDLMAVKAWEKDLEFVSMIFSNVPTHLRGDPVRLKQILINLIGNAIKFTEEGEVTIRVKPESESDTHTTLRFEIVDSGIGIPEDQRMELFDSFSQLDASVTRKYGGTGLGLAISRQLAELMRGDIGVISKLDEGSTFWFTARFEKQITQIVEKPIDVSEIKGSRILVVDDTATNREILCEYLNSWECLPESVENGPAALALLEEAANRNQAFEIAILDMRMPGMSGEELGHKIKHNEQLKQTTLIMLTSSGLPGEAPRAKEIGFAAYLTKPLKKNQLLETLRMIKSGKARNSDPNASHELVTRYSLLESKNRNQILLVEDNKVNQKLALRVLEKMGYRVEVAENGLEALESLERKSYDLVLMDLQMPKMGGLEATQTIRTPGSKVRDQEIPIIAMTAHAMEEDKRRCLEAGMNGFISKPFRKDNLQAEIERHLSNKTKL
jgi:signal transduction histidine kinase/CheY-like chemotaxis protein